MTTLDAEFPQREPNAPIMSPSERRAAAQATSSHDRRVAGGLLGIVGTLALVSALIHPDGSSGATSDKIELANTVVDSANIARVIAQTANPNILSQGFIQINLGKPVTITNGPFIETGSPDVANVRSLDRYDRLNNLPIDKNYTMTLERAMIEEGADGNDYIEALAHDKITGETEVVDILIDHGSVKYNGPVRNYQVDEITEKGLMVSDGDFHTEFPFSDVEASTIAPTPVTFPTGNH